MHTCRKDTSEAHYFYNQNWQLLEERFVDGQGATITSNQYVWSPRYIDALIVRFHDGDGDGDCLDAGDNVRYYTGDANYNVTSAIDAATGNVVERYVYTAYGATSVVSPTWINPTSPTTDGPLYSGYFLDIETAFYQVRNRYYEPSLSTFVNRDPISYRGKDLNLYRYCGNEPLTHVDPSGEAWYEWIPVVGTISNILTTPPGSSVADYAIVLNSKDCKECPALAEVTCMKNVDKQFYPT